MVTKPKLEERFPHESPTPQGRGGGGRRTHRPPPSAKSLANLKHWPKGVSGNPGGRKPSFYEAVRAARDLCPAVIQELGKIVFDPKAANRDKISAGSIILQRGLGYFTGERLDEDGNADSSAYGGLSPLLIAAGRGPVDIYRQELLSELHRIDAQARQERRESDDRLARIRAAAERGEEISAVDQMILQIKGETE